MASPRNRRHIIVPGDPNVEKYTPHPGGGGSNAPGPPGAGRQAHSAALTKALESARDTAALRRTTPSVEVTGAQPGLYLEFESFPGWELAIGSLENKRSKDPLRHIEVVAVNSDEPKDDSEPKTVKQRAAVFVPEGQVAHFVKQLERYALTTPKAERERRHENTYDRIASIRLAALRGLWTDADEAYPANADEPIWWEVWLRRTDGKELERLHDFAAQTNIRLGDRRLQFDDRIVTLAYTTAQTLAMSLDVLGDIAELQRAKEPATFFVEQGAEDQAAWVLDLAGRIQRKGGDDSPVVCVLDTGVNGGHPLLEGSLPADDCHAYEPSWGNHDHHGHGTEMAGLALFGDLVPLLAGNSQVELRHALESVKILPPNGENDPDLYGAITADAASRPEIQAPTRRRVFSMAVTTRDARDRGQPTSWSSAVDALAAGRTFDPSDKGLIYLDDGEDPQQRLFVVSAGNVDDTKLDRDHLTRSETEPVHDPAQAWNALTVGAYTEKVVITHPDFATRSPVAKAGELSPWSTTSMTFQPKWPIKPDIVMEGGNIVHDANGDVSIPWLCDDLSLLTTYFKPGDKPLVTTWATSAATAQAARICAEISAGYPDLWPETVRALVVHSARWTPTMMGHFDAAPNKTARARLVQRYGFGVPSLDRALRSAADAITLVAQGSIRPFEDGKMREIHIHDLPWPKDVLAGLGDAKVRLRVTLSYFVEPNPGRRGWQTKHRYQSHGLRFEVRGAAESHDEFRKRLNQQAMDEDEDRPVAGSDNGGWYLGPRARDRGSIHSDLLVDCTAADLAERGMIAVYPVTGWWKEQKKRDRSDKGARYALIVSIETDAADVDIWTPVANQVGVPVEIEVEV